MTEGRRRARRCPMCGIVNRPSVTDCECGHTFDGERDLPTMLRSRITVGWFMVGGGLVLTMGAVLLALVTSLVAIGIAAPAIALFVKGTRVVDAARHGLRELAAVPKARLLKG
jgi:hypothetical protein